MKEIKSYLFYERIIISEAFCTVNITPTSLGLSLLPANNSAILVQCFIAGLISVPLPGHAALRPKRSFSSNQGKEAEVRKDNRHGKKYRGDTCLRDLLFLWYYFFLKILPKAFKAKEGGFGSSLLKDIWMLLCLCYIFVSISLHRWFRSSWDRWWMLCFTYTNKIFGTGEQKSHFLCLSGPCSLQCWFSGALRQGILLFQKEKQGVKVPDFRIVFFYF